MSKLTIEKVRKILLEQFDIYCRSERSCHEELGFLTSLGEDFSFSICHLDTGESLADALLMYAANFDPEEHAAMWYGSSSCTHGLRELLEDAEDIQCRIKEAAFYINKCVEKGIPAPTDALFGPDNQSDLLDHIIDYCASYEPEVFKLKRTTDGYVETGEVGDDCAMSFSVSYRGEDFIVSVMPEV